MKTFTVRLPLELYKALKHMAVEKDVPLQKLVQEAIQNLVKEK